MTRMQQGVIFYGTPYLFGNDEHRYDKNYKDETHVNTLNTNYFPPHRWIYRVLGRVGAAG